MERLFRVVPLTLLPSSRTTVRLISSSMFPSFLSLLTPPFRHEQTPNPLKLSSLPSLLGSSLSLVRPPPPRPTSFLELTALRPQTPSSSCARRATPASSLVTFGAASRTLPLSRWVSS
jgi:hypothetical protein